MADQRPVPFRDFDLNTRRKLGELGPWKGAELATHSDAELQLLWVQQDDLLRFGYLVKARGVTQRGGAVLLARRKDAPLWVSRPETDEFDPVVD